jgi:hypothetical protein
VKVETVGGATFSQVDAYFCGEGISDGSAKIYAKDALNARNEAE